MNVITLKLPARGFTKAERAWLAELIKEINTVVAIQGRNISVTNTDKGQVIDAQDCKPCDPCP